MDSAHATAFTTPRQRGLTLIELLVVIVVAGILMGWAVPGLQAMHARQEVVAEAHRLRTALVLGRNSAITRRSTVIVCPSPDRQSCHMDDWSAPLAIVLGPLSGSDFAPTPCSGCSRMAAASASAIARMASRYASPNWVDRRDTTAPSASAVGMGRVPSWY